MIRRAAVALVALAVLIVASAGHAGAATAVPSGATAVQRVLVISLPATSWSDIEAGDDPHLQQLLSQSAVADMITRAAGRKSSIAGGYTALGAGGRASAVTPLAGQAFEPSEPYGESTAADVYRQRTGLPATSGLVHLGLDALVQENADGLYDPTIGALGDDLAKHRVPRAVIANGDGAQPVVDDPLPEFQRAAVNALMGSDGRVPGGAVGDELLEPDPHAPFGVRMDNDAAYRAFSDAWRTGGVVLVEGSDLLRADLYTDFLTDDQARVQKQAALHRTDELRGPHARRRRSGARRGVRREPGVAPARLGPRGVGHPRAGREARAAPLGDQPARRLRVRDRHRADHPRPARLPDTVDDGRPRHGGGVRRPRARRAHQDAHPGQRGRGLPRFEGGDRQQHRARPDVPRSRSRRGTCSDVRPGAPASPDSWRWGCWGSSSPPTSPSRCTSAAAATRRRTSGSSRSERWRSPPRARSLGARRRYLPLALALAATVALHVGDLLAGARLELNTVFGYSATVGIRVSGQGNITFSQLTAAALLLGGLVVWRRPRRSTVYAVIAMLAITLLVMAAPPWGGDFGAAIACAPGFGLFAWLLLGRRVRLRTVVILGAVLVVAGLLVGFADLMRPKDQQTHVGRFFDKVATGGLGDFFLTIRRKATENIDSFTGTRLLWVLPIVALLVWFLWRVRGGRVRPLFREVPVIRQTMLALAVVAFLGYALNDSGIAIPSLMAVVFECALVYVALVPAREPVTDPPSPPPVVPDPPTPDEPRAREPQLV